MSKKEDKFIHTIVDGEEVLIGQCEICGRTQILIHDHYDYNHIKCDCHDRFHQEDNFHYKDCCDVAEPISTTVKACDGESYVVPTDCLKNLDRSYREFDLVHFLRQHGAVVPRVKFQGGEYNE